MVFLILVAYFVVNAQALPLKLTENHNLDQEWNIYKTQYSKVYKGDEEQERRIIWESNVKYISEHNILYNSGKRSYNLGINHFSDLSQEEFNAMFPRIRVPVKLNTTRTFKRPKSKASLPYQVDWRQTGCVSPVKNQGSCGSCWAFSATGALEGQYCLQNGFNLISFSEQQLVDCVPFFGCNWGIPMLTYLYIKWSGGIQSEIDYPYTAKVGACKFDINKAEANVSGFELIEPFNEEELAAAVAIIGPISVVINSNGKDFHQFTGPGVYDDPFCSPYILTHAVLVVGYGTQNGKDYWLVKNSWTEDWGDNGYIKMARNKNNQCGIADFATFPVV